MKWKLNRWFTSLSLTQQVFSMIIIMLIFLSFFFVFILSDSINSTITSLMYTMMENDQRPLAALIVDNEENAQLADREVAIYMRSVEPEHGFLYRDGQVVGELPEEEPGLTAFLQKEAEKLDTSVGDVQEGSFAGHKQTFYYRLQRVVTNSGQTVLVTFMDSTYALKFRDTLINSTVYVTVVVFFILLMAILMWVFSIIRPLNQIRSYISQIKEGKDVELHINRNDEIGDLADELVAMKEELDKQDKSKEEMIHNISHDLKTPIATIKSYSESIKDGIYPYGDLDSSVDVILDNAQRLEDKVHNLLYLNRVEYLVSSDAAGVVTNMKDVVEQVVLNSAVLRPEIEVITDVEEVFFDGLIEAWRVTIENIMENAFRYAKSYIKIRVRENCLEISNDGPKIEKSKMESMFRPYEMGEGGRFGLGLSIVSKVVRANNYKVKGFNTPDGVCFRIWRDVPKQRQRTRRSSKK